MAQAKILVVEDEGLIANDIACTLDQCGHQVIGIASSGEEAITLVQEFTPDLVLMDIRLRGEMDGIDAALTIRLEHDVPIVFLTSYADMDTLTRAKQAMPYGYLTKPFTAPTLTSTVEIAVYKHSQDHALVLRGSWLAAALYATATPTLITDAEGRILLLSASAERLLGCLLSQVVGTTWTTTAPLFHTDTGTALPDILSEALLRAETRRLPRDTVLRRSGMVDIAIEGEIAPRQSRGEIAGAVITLRDITERVEEERFFRQEQKMQGMAQLAHGVANQFEKHLAVIRRQGEALDEIVSSTDELERVRVILNTAESAGEITEQLLMLSGGLVENAGSVQVNAAIERMVEIEVPEENSGITVSTALDPRAGAVRMESRDFAKILVILLANAFEAMPCGGAVRVSTAIAERIVGNAKQDDDGPFVQIKVSDSGTGLSREAQEHLFEPYFTTKEPGAGAGLGLSIVHAITTSVGGRIVVTSTTGVGASFELYLPMMNRLPSLGRCNRQTEEQMALLDS